MRKSISVFALLSILGLSACGDTFGEQALIGAGVGAGTAVVLDQDPLAGAAIGGGANVLYCQNNPGSC
jgi:hypothetical protein